MRYPRSFPDIRDEMQKLHHEMISHLDTERDTPDLGKIVERLSRLTGALTEAIVDQMRGQ